MTRVTTKLDTNSRAKRMRTTSAVTRTEPKMAGSGRVAEGKFRTHTGALTKSQKVVIKKGKRTEASATNLTPKKTTTKKAIVARSAATVKK